MTTYSKSRQSRTTESMLLGNGAMIATIVCSCRLVESDWPRPNFSCGQPSSLPLRNHPRWAGHGTPTVVPQISPTNTLQLTDVQDKQANKVPSAAASLAVATNIRPVSCSHVCSPIRGTRIKKRCDLREHIPHLEKQIRGDQPATNRPPPAV